MEYLNFKRAYFIKLGTQGCWAKDSIDNGYARIGWKNVDLNYINNGNWDVIKKVVKRDFDERRKKNGATQDYEALKRFCEATKQDVFITFHNGFMYWCSLDDSPVEQDDTSKFRRTKNDWSNNQAKDFGRLLYSNEISGEISKTQAFQGTICQFKEKEVDIINRIINNLSNPDVAQIQIYKHEICKLTTKLLKDLHWKDCEILTDLIFIQSGWRRVSMQGGNMEFTDMEYFDPINNEKYAVQIKSGANKSDFLEYEKKFKDRGFRKLFFVVFNPDDSFAGFKTDRNDVELLFGEKLSTMIFDLGLLEWVLKKSF